MFATTTKSVQLSPMVFHWRPDYAINWCRSEGKPMFSKQNLPKDMEAKGFPSRKKRVAGFANPLACYFGIALLPDNDSDDGELVY